MKDNYFHDDYLDKNTFSDELIAFLFSCHSNSIRKKILWERLRNRQNLSRSIYTQNIYRLKKRGIIKNEKDSYILSKKGIIYHSNPYKIIKNKPTKKQKILLIFDIPEVQKKSREWVRRQIKLWDFKMIQKSVWAGNGPLPKEFFDRLKILKIEKCVKTFKVQSK